MLTNFGIGTLAAVLARRLGAGIHLAGCRRFGRLAQLVERLLYTQNVGGSSPSPPTSLRSLCELRLGKPALDVRGDAREGCRAEAVRRRRAPAPFLGENADKRKRPPPSQLVATACGR